MSDDVIAEAKGPSETSTVLEKGPVTASPEEATLPPHVIPNGGLRAWSTVAGSWLVILCTFGYLNAFGVYQTYYVETLLPSYSASAISWIGSIQLFFLFAIGMVAGRLFDAGYVRYLLVVGTVLYVGCLFALSAAQEDAYYQVFLSQGVGQGLAGIIFPIMLNNLFEKSGFKWGVRASGFFILGCLVLANVLMSPHPNPHHKGMPKTSILKLLKDPPYSVSAAGVFLIGWGIFMPFFFIQLFTVTHGISENLSFYTLAIVNAASVFGRTLPNFLAHKTGPVTLLIPSSIISPALVFALLGVKSAGSVIAFCILYGFFSGSFFSLIPPMLASMADSMSEIGIRIGVAFFIVGIAALTGTPINGALLGDGPQYAWWKASLFSGVTMLAGAALLVVTWHLLGKKKMRRWV